MSCLHRQALILGICLGAQLIACTAGARVRPNPVKEIDHLLDHFLDLHRDTGATG